MTARRKRAGMMRSVSRSSPRNGSARPEICVMLDIFVSLAMERETPSANTRPHSGELESLRVHFLEHLAHVCDLAGNRCGGDHCRAHQQRPAGGAALAALEVAVRR